MNFNSPQELVSYLRSNLGKKYFKKISITDTGDLSKKNVINVKVVTDDDRYNTYEALIDLLGRSAVPKLTSDQLYLNVLYVKCGYNSAGKEISAKILIKPSDGSLYFREPLFNRMLANLSNFKNVRMTPGSVYEYRTIKEFNDSVEKIGQGLPVHVSMQDKLFKNIVGMVSGPAGAKADLVLIDKDGQAQCFISHKAGSSPKDFQQYSGISGTAGSFIANNAEVIKFKNDVAGISQDKLTKTSYIREIRNIKIKEKAVFGKDFSKSITSKSPDNIDFFAQGDVIINLIGTKSDAVGKLPLVRLNFSTKLVHKSKINLLTTNNYDPVLAARPGESYRKLESELTTVYGVRAGIFPEGTIKTRKHEKI